jgi:alpha-D-ribose 1-methylphosphonate 5-triphosphate diphosphatase
VIELDLVGAAVLRAEGLETGMLSLQQGKISEAPVGRACNLEGFILLPGIVDLHGDAFERHVAPRRGAMTDMVEGIHATERELAAQGITTAVLAQFVSWEGGLRGLDFADKVFHAIRDARPGLVTDIRPQLRLEIHLTEIFEELPERLAQWGVDYVVFNDHLPHDRLAQGRRPQRLVGQALKAGRNPDQHFEHLLTLEARTPEVAPALDRLCTRLAALSIRMGSHDDATEAQQAQWAERGVGIAEFPETAEAARAARARGACVVLGAPNLVRGASHKGNASAADLVAQGLCDALASDYHYPSPRRAALKLVSSGAASWAEAWRLVSAGPAAALGLDDRGQLCPGARADLLVLEADTHRVAATMSGGRFSFVSGDVAERLIAA